MLTPTRSAGSRSGVNWTRFHEQSMEAASALARLVLPTPGTSSISRWPSASRHMTAISIGSILPWTTCAMFAVMASNSDAKREDGPSAAGTSLLRARLGETVTAVKGRRGSAPIPCRSLLNAAGEGAGAPAVPNRVLDARQRRGRRNLNAAGEGAGAPAVPNRSFTSERRGRNVTLHAAASPPARYGRRVASYLAIDVANDRLAAGIVDELGEVVVRDRVTTPPRDVWPALHRLVRRVVAARPDDVDEPVACGVSCEGPIDQDEGNRHAAAPPDLARVRAAGAGPRPVRAADDRRHVRHCPRARGALDRSRARRDRPDGAPRVRRRRGWHHLQRATAARRSRQRRPARSCRRRTRRATLPVRLVRLPHRICVVVGDRGRDEPPIAADTVVDRRTHGRDDRAGHRVGGRGVRPARRRAQRCRARPRSAPRCSTQRGASSTSAAGWGTCGAAPTARSSWCTSRSRRSAVEAALVGAGGAGPLGAGPQRASSVTRP